MISDEEREARLIDALIDDAEKPERWWWLSFADGARPAGQQFLGVVIVKATGLSWAIRRSHDLKINPGGEVQVFDAPTWADPPEKFRNRLLTKAECEEVDAIFASQKAGQ